MEVSTRRGSIYDVKADVFSLPMDSDLSIDPFVASRAGMQFVIQYCCDFNQPRDSLPLVRPTVIKVNKGDAMSCEALMLVFHGSIKGVPTKTDLLAVRQAYKKFFDYIDEYRYESVAITLPLTSSRELLSEILYAVFNRAPQAHIFDVVLVSESPSELEIVHSLLGAKAICLDYQIEIKEMLKSLKVAPPSLFLSAFKKISRKRKTSKTLECAYCSRKFTFPDALARHRSMEHWNLKSVQAENAANCKVFIVEDYTVQVIEASMEGGPHSKVITDDESIGDDSDDDFSLQRSKMEELRDAYLKLSNTFDAFDEACKKIKTVEEIDSFCSEAEKLITRYLK